MEFSILRDYAMSFVGREYLYGGNGPYFDCSGFVIEILKAAGIAPPHDCTAQQIFEFLKPKSTWNSREAGAVAFYGRSTNTISHVAWMIDSNTILEAGGGDSTTVTFEEARKRNAFIRMRPLTGNIARKDLVCTMLPLY